MKSFLMYINFAMEILIFSIIKKRRYPYEYMDGWEKSNEN